MSKFRALVVSTLIATTLVGGAVSAGGADEAKAPITTARDTSPWCC